MAAINCILHPHHVSLSKHPYTLSSVLNQFQDRIDPYYEVDGKYSHKGLIAPKFDVCETEFAYLLYGEVPGVKDKQQISVEWLQSQTLFVRGSIKPEDTAPESVMPEKTADDLAPIEMRAESKPAEVIHNGLSNIAPMKDHDEYTGPRHWLRERQVGDFERSFSFPTHIEPNQMKATLADGLLKIVVPKRLGASGGIKRIPVM